MHVVFVSLGKKLLAMEVRGVHLAREDTTVRMRELLHVCNALVGRAQRNRVRQILPYAFA